MAVLPITRVSADDNLVVAKPSIRNLAIAVNLKGIPPPVIGGGIVNDSKLTSGKLNFPLVALCFAPVATAVRLSFSGAIVQPKITLGTQTGYGTATISKGALVIKPEGLGWLAIPSPLVLPDGYTKTDFNLYAAAVESNSSNSHFHFGPIVIAKVGVGASLRLGNPVLVNAFNIKPAGIPANSDNSKPFLIYASTGAQGLSNFNITDQIQASDDNVRFNFGGASPVTQVGSIHQEKFGRSGIKSTSGAIRPAPILSGKVGLPLVYPASQKNTVQYGVLTTNLDRQVQPQNSLNIPFSFFGDIQLSAIGWRSSSIGRTSLINKKTIATPSSWQSSEVGSHKIANSISIVNATGIVSNVHIGHASLRNSAVIITVVGVSSPTLHAPSIYNLKQFALPQGLVGSSYGNAYLKGGVRWLHPYGLNNGSAGYPKLTNITADQYAYPTGIARTAVVPAPIITPHMIYANGIYGTQFGNTAAIPTPVISIKGIVHTRAGTPTVWYHTRSLTVSGFESYDTGYPRVFDPTQFIQPSAFVRTAVFGDTSAKNVWTFVKGAGAIDSETISQWSVVENRNRRYIARGFLSQAVGSQSIKNKSPSIFFNGLPAPNFNAPAIGYHIRTIAPTGFDRLQLGLADVVKTPELKPFGYIATQFGAQWVSNRTRYIEQYGRDYSATGTPIVWFRFRYASPQSWQSLLIGDGATVTHGVREVIAQGFIQQGYGVAWVSRGTRLLEPTSIYMDSPSNHFVGRHQELKPFGYIATLFGTRIIPESQSLYPLGFAGIFGQTTAYLQTQYLKPKGYLSAGEQPAFRWGRQIVQNSIQYIVQNFAGDSGLVPPKWSDWTAIANRNKTIGAIGTLMQRFGYAQIDNNARLLAPKGLIATRFDKSMIAYGIRKLPVQGIEAPYMAGWHVIHKSAREVEVVGDVQSLFGNADVVKTRRYFDRIGRIESFASGVPMIAYRIRTIDIEKRYSIAPPAIKLPTVDLRTRYVDFSGYETAKYGLASLSIHFRIITPRWSHSEKSGSPALRNATPELLTRGRDSQEYGTANVRTQWRNVYAQGEDNSAVGLPKISDTKQHISVHGFIDSSASQQHRVIRTGSAPYLLQYIWLHDEDGSNQNEGYGIAPPNLSNPWLNQNVIYHQNKEISSRFGAQFVWSNNITVFSGIGIDGVSEALIVSNKNNVISMAGIDNKILCGQPRLSPHTIYSVVEAPQQAQDNHPTNRDLHYVGGIYRGSYTVGEVFGNAFVESSIRQLHAYWYRLPSSVVGRPSIELSKKHIKPNGIRLGRFGVPAIPFTLQSIELRDGFYSSAFGLTKLDRPPYTGPQYISTKDFYSTAFGNVYSDNFDRTLFSHGVETLKMGLSEPRDTPFMWQGLRVGERVPLIIGGDDMSSYGDAGVSLRIREVGVKGFNAFISQYDISAFDERITVKNTDKKLPVKLTITTSSINPTNTFGYQNIKLGQHYIRPDGNSDQFRKGGYHA